MAFSDSTSLNTAVHLLRFRLVLRPLKAACVLASSDAENTLERSPHGKRSPKSTSIRDLLKAHRGTIDQLLRRLHAHAIDELARAHSHFAETNTCEVARAHSYPFRECFNT